MPERLSEAYHPREVLPSQYQLRACIGPLEYSWDGKVLQNLDAERISFSYDNPRIASEANILTAGWDSYGISGISESNKKSFGYMNCTGLAVVGVKKNQGMNISLLSHQNTGSVLHADRDVFMRHLRKRLTECVEQMETNTIDALLFGGLLALRKNPKHDSYLSAYRDITDTVAKEVESILGIDVHVVGPSVLHDEGEGQHVWLDTKTRRLYLKNDDEDTPMKPVIFRGSDLQKIIQSWEENKI